jgi:hypothetical protein
LLTEGRGLVGGELTGGLTVGCAVGCGFVGPDGLAGGTGDWVPWPERSPLREKPP